MSGTMYESPDGEDCLYKTGWCTWNAAKIGYLWGLYDAIAVKEVRGVLRFCGRVGYIMMTPMAMAAIYSSMTCISAHVRGKNGPMNHCVGAVAAASVIALHYSPVVALMYSPYLGISAAMVKDFKDHGGMMWEDKHMPVQREWFFNNNDPVIGFRLTKKLEEPTDY